MKGIHLYFIFFSVLFYECASPIQRDRHDRVDVSPFPDFKGIYINSLSPYTDTLFIGLGGLMDRAKFSLNTLDSSGKGITYRGKWSSGVTGSHTNNEELSLKVQDTLLPNFTGWACNVYVQDKLLVLDTFYCCHGEIVLNAKGRPYRFVKELR